ncbi:MAG TPA: three-Cys-motif partner protein TcmP, partial [Ignavibacteria bacterium]|nr:three-Cys-motif partner protein TcmP [Ignavibacteria bacterium]
MSTKKLFNKPFDDGTIAKLLIFENYLNSWLPTFILASGNKPIQIFDLFAGAGYDSEKTEGSPLRSLRIINKFKDLLNNFNKSVYMYLNDTNSTNISNLKIICKNKINEYGLEDIVKLTYSEIPFNTFITKHNSILNNGCNLIFADQYGLKEINENVFKTLINFPFTDFIFFISSSVLHRFPDEPEIKKHHPKFDFDKIRNCDQKNIHNVVCQEYRKY